MPRPLTAALVAVCLLPALAPGASPSYEELPAFEPLPLGAIKPTGWLREWCEQAADGITGHGDELTPVLAKGWVGDGQEGVDIEDSAMQKGDRREGYALEQAAYWIDGAVRLGHLLDDKELLDKCQARFDAILKRVEAGQPPMNVNQGMWERGEKWAHWPMAVMGRALIAEYSATGDPRYLNALQKIYAGYSKRDHDNFSLIEHNGRQVMNTEVMLEAYRMGGDEELRDEAITVLKDQEGEIEERLNWHEQEIANGRMDDHFNKVEFGHAVTFNESAKLPAIGYLYTGNPDWLRFAEAGFEAMRKNEMLPYGLTSAHEQPGGIEPFAMTELCNAIDYSWTNIWLLRITGKGVYGDAIEKTVFNAGAGGISHDFKQHAYYLSPNRIDAKHPDRSPTGAGGSAHFAPTHQPLCCTANVSRLLPNYVMNLWMATADGGLAATLYGPSMTQTTVRGTPVKVETRTDYPFREKVGIMISAKQNTRFPLHLRIPEWSDTQEITINGKPENVTAENGFVKIDREWSQRDIVTLAFPAKPEVVTGECRDGAPYASVYYGPLLFALPIPTQGGNLNAAVSGVETQFALAPGAKIEVVENPMPTKWSWGATPPPLELEVAAQPLEPGNGFSLEHAPVAPGRSEMITLIPFGSTIFRVSMFSVAEAPAQTSSL